MINNNIEQNTRIVAIGGGHGLGRLLSAFGYLEDHLTGIVATTDNGGSTGRLREETGCIAWGDLRNCL
ncbi:MAG: 2-phospho-L-lactate transferase CofD family protein, partial [Gammaproteobacteria bacterium]|nr:2-phospho-L-lactate transferase CofD family protein [Gammaproteobacteria bacterium]